MNIEQPFFFIIIFFALQVQAQDTVPPRFQAYLDFTVAAGNQEATAAFFYLRNIKAVYQFFFAEYYTQTIHRKAPGGTEVYRFRNGRICRHLD